MTENLSVPGVKPQKVDEATSRFLRGPKNLREGDFLLLRADDQGVGLIAEAVSLQVGEREGWETISNDGVTYTRVGGGSFGLTSFLDRFPERKRRTVSRIALPTSEMNIAVLAQFPKDRIIWQDDSAKMMIEYVETRIDLANRRALMAARFKEDGTVPPLPFGYQDHADYPLSDYQKTAIAMTYHQEGVALFMDRGTGKTAVSVIRVCEEARTIFEKEGRMMRVLVVAPNQVRLNWQREFSKFATVPGKAVVVKGSKLRRVRLFSKAVIETEEKHLFGVAIAGYDSVAAHKELFQMVQWDLIICDESHYFKNSRTRRWKAIKSLRECSNARMILTGTPIGNRLRDIHPQMEFLGEGCSGFASEEAFNSFHARYDKEESGEGAEALYGYTNVPLFQERLARVAFIISKKEAGLNLPDKVYDYHEVEMTKRQATLYNQLRDDLTAKIDAMRASDMDKSVTVNSTLTLLLRLAQITCGYIKYDPIRDENNVILEQGSIEAIDDVNPKVEAVMQMLQDPTRDPNAKTVIWTNFVWVIKEVSRRLTDEGIGHRLYYGGVKDDGSRQQAEDDFNNDPEIKVMVCNPQTAGEGLNLLGYDVLNPDDTETYCDHEIYFSNNWSFVQRSQSEDRCHRRGMRGSLRITDIVVPDSIDMEILRVLHAKEDLSTSVQNLDRVLQNVLHGNI